jgi:hypothetical protein
MITNYMYYNGAQLNIKLWNLNIETIDPLLGNGPVNISPQHTIALNNRTSVVRGTVNKLHQQYRLCFPLDPCVVCITTACN